LVGVFERCGQRRHDLSTISQISSNLRPFLVFADALEPAANFDGFLEFVQIQRAFVDARKAIEVRTILLVEFGQLVQIVEVCPISCPMHQNRSENKTWL
jgi:hypothetical protein